MTSFYPGERFWHRYEVDYDLMERRASFARALLRLRKDGEKNALRSLRAIAKEMCQP